MMTQQAPPTRRKRQMAREPKTGDMHDVAHNVEAVAAPKAPSRLDQLEQLLSRTEGASIAEMMDATGWQAHSIRGAMAGTLKRKRGLVITSQKLDGLRRYRASLPS